MESGQTTLQGVVKRTKPLTTSKQKNFEEAVTDYIVYNLRPYNTVDNKEFRHLVALLDPTMKLMGRTKLMRTVQARAQKDRQVTIETFRNAKYVATSADVWSCTKHGYIGMTASTILPTFERVSRAIACKHFKNPHSGEKIAEIIADVHQSLELELTQLVGTITDNGGNIVKAFNIGAVDSNIKFVIQELINLSKTLPKHQR